MKTNAAVLLIALLSLLFQGVQSKVARCREVLNKYDRDFFYCTKFSVGLG
jgi:hypothetical protein